MKKIVYGLVCLSLFFASCKSEKNDREYIMSNIENVNTEVNFSDILSKYSFVILEMSDKSLVGQINKVVKKDDKFFIGCDRKNVLVFNSDGSFVTNISNIGSGPNDYSEMIDFDSDGENIAILGFKKILFYDLEGNLKKKLNIDDICSNVKLMGDKILTTCTKNDKIISVLDSDGKKISSYLDKRQAHLLKKTNPLIRYNKSILFQNGAYVTDMWSFDNKKETFSKLIEQDNVINKTEEDELVNQQGFEYVENGVSKMLVSSVISSGDRIMCGAMGTDGAYLYIGNSDKTKCYQLMPSPVINDDIAFLGIINFIGLAEKGESDNSFISIIYPYKIAEALEKNKTQANTPQYKALQKIIDSISDIENANPILFEFKFK